MRSRLTGAPYIALVVLSRINLQSSNPSTAPPNSGSAHTVRRCPSSRCADRDSRRCLAPPSHLSNPLCPFHQVWKSSEATVPTCNIRQALLDERRSSRPPVQVEVPFGCLLLRDPRTWHAGMPNPSSEDRTMIAMGELGRSSGSTLTSTELTSRPLRAGYTAPWFPRDNRFLVRTYGNDDCTSRTSPLTLTASIGAPLRRANPHIQPRRQMPRHLHPRRRVGPSVSAVGCRRTDAA